MKVRFYCDIPARGVRLGSNPPWNLCAMSVPGSGVLEGYTRVAFDVDLPPNLVLPPYDVVAPADAVLILEEGE